MPSAALRQPLQVPDELPVPLDALSDEQLMEWYQVTSDERAYAVLYARYERELLSYLRQVLGDHHLAQDALQDVFTKLYLKRHQFSTVRQFKPWIYTIASHEAIDVLRRERRRRTVSIDVDDASSDGTRMYRDLFASTDDDPAISCQEVEDRDRLHRAIRALPQHLCFPLVLAYFEKITYRDIAALLGIPCGTVKSRIHTAIIKLRRVLVPTLRCAQQRRGRASRNASGNPRSERHSGDPLRAG